MEENMKKIFLLCVLLNSGCGLCKTHVIVYEVQVKHVHAPFPITSVSMKTTLTPTQDRQELSNGVVISE
jgi:hypothetical protein